MKAVWVVEPLSDGSCRVYEVRTHDDGTFSVSKPVRRITAALLFEDAPEDTNFGCDVERHT